MNTRCTAALCSLSVTLALIGLVVVLYGCAAAEDATSAAAAPQQSSAASRGRESGRMEPQVHVRRGSEPTATVIDARPAAMINGHTVSWGELKPFLTERAGAEILQEVALDHVLNEMIRERGVVIGSDAIAAERRMMQEMLDPDDPDRAARLLRELRTRTGLGEQRFEALLRRNASLRALVRDRVQLSEQAVRQMFDAVHGPRRQVRLITLPSLSEVQQAQDRIEAGEAFGDVAVDVSTDASASRGGLLEPISRSDPSYPESFRRAVWELEEGALSSPLLLDEHYAVMQLVREIKGDDAEFEDVRDDMERRVRLSQERMHMDHLARSLIADASITIFDRTLRESWELRRRRRE